jgi:prepilin-type N-terminal cleavage/methylation domain-containing protein
MSKGFSLVEVLLALVIIGILAGFMAMMFGSSTDSADAKSIAANLDSVKQATLSYSTTHQRRNTDVLAALEGVSNATNFKDALSRDLDRAMPQTMILKDMAAGDPSGLPAGRYVAFVSLQVGSKVAKALGDIANQGSGYRLVSGDTGYAFYLKLN